MYNNTAAKESVKFTVSGKVSCAYVLLYFVRRVSPFSMSSSILSDAKPVFLVAGNSHVIADLKRHWLLVVHDGDDIMALLTSVIVDIVQAVVGIGRINAVSLHQLVRHSAHL